MKHLKVVTTLHSGKEEGKTIYPKVTNAMGPRVASTPSQGEKPSMSVENLEEERNVEKNECQKWAS